MDRKIEIESDAGALRVWQEFEAWRVAANGRRRPFSMELWKAAADLAGQFGLYKTSRWLRLCSADLRRRMNGENRTGVRKSSTKPVFVELPPTSMREDQGKSGFVVELLSCKGEKLTIRCGDNQNVDVPALAQMFLRFRS